MDGVPEPLVGPDAAAGEGPPARVGLALPPPEQDEQGVLADREDHREHLVGVGREGRLGVGHGFDASLF